MRLEEAESLDVYQRTPGWVLPKIDFEFTPLARRASASCLVHRRGEPARPSVDGRLHGGAHRASAPTAARQASDPRPAALRHVVARTPAASRDGRRPGVPKVLVPRIGILAKCPVISSAFFKALNNPNTALITTRIERITRNGVRTADGVEREVDLIVAATGYELWTDPLKFCASGFDLAEDYRAHGMRSYAAQHIRACRTVGRSSGRLASLVSHG